MMNVYRVKKLAINGPPIAVSVPASKSILARALLLAAFSGRDCLLRADGAGDDTRDMLSCLRALGVGWELTEGGIRVLGSHAPKKTASLDVGSAGTAARFLPAVLAFYGGEYRFTCSPQMQRRPMALDALRACGATVECLGKREGFPFLLRSDGANPSSLSLGTDTSTQFASGIMLASAATRKKFCLRLTGERTDSSYIRMTCALIRAFGTEIDETGDTFSLSPCRPAPEEYAVEPDLSGACYFYALSLLLGRKVLVRGVRLPSLQGDAAFLKLLEARGVLFRETEEGLVADGTNVTAFDGFNENMRDLSDQALTVAALAPFARTPSRITGISHICRQECDRIAAIEQNLTALGVPCTADGESVTVSPAPVKGGRVNTFGDHRVAMAFTLTGLRAGGVEIENPACTAKTFPHFFETVDALS